MCLCTCIYYIYIYIWLCMFEKDGILFTVYSSRGSRRRTAGLRVLQSIENPVIISRPEHALERRARHKGNDE